MKEDLGTVKEDLYTVKKDLDTVKEDINELKEDTKITRSATNTLLEWAEEAQVQVRVPLFKKASEG